MNEGPIIRAEIRAERLRRQDQRQDLYEGDRAVAGLVLLGAVAAGLYYLFAWLWPRILLVRQSLSRLLKPWYGQVLIGVTLVAFGVCLYRFRLRHRKTYGTMEFLVGLCFCFKAAGDLAAAKGPLVWLSMITGATFLIVRGLDNRRQGIEEQKAAKRKAGEHAFAELPDAPR